MTPDAWIVLGLIALMMVAFISDRFPAESVGIGGAVVLLLSGILSPARCSRGLATRRR